MAEAPFAGLHEGPTSRLYLHPETMHARRITTAELLLVSSGGRVILTGRTFCTSPAGVGSTPLSSPAPCTCSLRLCRLSPAPWKHRSSSWPPSKRHALAALMLALQDRPTSWLQVGASTAAAPLQPPLSPAAAFPSALPQVPSPTPQPLVPLLYGFAISTSRAVQLPNQVRFATMCMQCLAPASIRVHLGLLSFR